MKHILWIMPDRLINPIGGLGVQALELLKILSKEYKITVLGFPQDGKIDLQNVDYIPVYIPMRGVDSGSIMSLISQGAYAHEASKVSNVDVVHCFDWSASLGAIFAKDYHKAKMLFTMQLSIIELDKQGIRYCGDYNTNDGRKLHEAHCNIERAGLYHADKIIHVSNAYSKRFAASYPQYSSKSVIMPNGVNLSDWSKKKLTISSEKIKACYIGRYATMKGIDIILNADIPENIDFFFLGNEKGSDSNLYEKAIEKANRHRNVHFIGALYGKQKEEFLNAMDFVVMPSIHEPFGIVALEAFASQSVLITTASDGLSDFCSAENSIIIEKNSKSLSDVLKRLDQYDVNKIKHNALKTVESYTWDKSALILSNLYKNNA